MANNLSTSVEIQFAPDAPVNGDAGDPITLQNVSWPVPPGTYAVKMTPGIGATFYATDGTITEYSGGEETVPGQFISVSGGTSFETPNGIGYQVVFAFTNPSSGKSLGFERSKDGRTVNANQPFWGLIKLPTYKRSFKILAYKPKTINPLLGQGYSVVWGMVAAFSGNQVATLQVEPVTDVEQGTDEFEIYRITSKVLINDQGPWEYPPNWPESGAYSDGKQPEPEPEIGLVTSRIHEIGYANDMGDVWTRTQYVKIEQPYTGVLGYTPVKTLTETSLPSGLSYSAQVRIKEALAARGKGVL